MHNNLKQPDRKMPIERTNVRIKCKVLVFFYLDYVRVLWEKRKHRCLLSVAICICVQQTWQTITLIRININMENVYTGMWICERLFELPTQHILLQPLSFSLCQRFIPHFYVFEFPAVCVSLVQVSSPINKSNYKSSKLKMNTLN